MQPIHPYHDRWLKKQFGFLKESGNYFSVRIDKLDVSGIEERLNDALNRADDYLSRNFDHENAELCYQDRTGEWNHEWGDCLAMGWCPFQQKNEYEEKLNRLELRSMLFLCFQDPENAVDQRTLEGMAQPSSIYKTS